MSFPSPELPSLKYLYGNALSLLPFCEGDSQPHDLICYFINFCSLLPTPRSLCPSISLLSPHMILHNTALWGFHSISSHLHHFLSLTQPLNFHHCCHPILGSCCHLFSPLSLTFSQFSSRMFTSSHPQWTPFISVLFFPNLLLCFPCIMPVLVCLGCCNKVP